MSVRSIELPAPASPSALPATRPVAAQVAPAKTKAALHAAPVVVETAMPTHIAAGGLDMPPMLRSAPDAAMVEGAVHSGMPIRLRLYIEGDGTVSDIELLFAQIEDEPAAQRLADMFRAAGFVPGRLNGRDVASFLDVEVDALPQALSLRAD